MKIEIGESLFLSWLRHAKGCQLVQTNWKPSTSSWELLNEEEVERLMGYSIEYFRTKYGIDVFKKNTSYMQFLQQAEVDALGMAMTESGQEYYAIDVAFHEAGLNYGSKDETAMRVVKKIIRTAMCLRAFFDTNNGTIIFASPKIHKSTMDVLVPYMEDIDVIFKEFNYDFQIRLFGNGDFKEKVFDPVIAASGIVSDTSELFMRSIQMYNLFASDKYSKSKVLGKRKIQASSINIEQIEVTDSSSLSEMKIGVFVKTNIMRLIEERKISKEEIELMTSKKYSKKIFNMNLPVLKEVVDDLPISQQRVDQRGYGRYWNFTIKIYGKEYLVCSQWVEGLHRSQFIEWMKVIEK